MKPPARLALLAMVILLLPHSDWGGGYSVHDINIDDCPSLIK